MSGELDFVARLEYDNLKKDVRKIQREFAGLANKAESEGARIDRTFKRVGAGIAAYFGTQQLFSFAKAVAMTRGEFQQLEVAFTTMLGSKAKADKLMKEVVEFAATTPYELKDVGKGAKQLLAFQVPAQEITATLRQLGDLAAGAGTPLNDLVSIYGKVKAKGKLQAEEMNLFLERGIPLISELAEKYQTTESAIYKMASEGKIGFSDLQGVISKLTGEGGMFFNLMEEQSKTITGQLSNLQDAWDSMLNEIGQNSEGIISGAIDGAKFLIQNYEEVAKILGTLIASYGVYKASLMTIAAHKRAVDNTHLQVESKQLSELLTKKELQANGIKNINLLTKEQALTVKELATEKIKELQIEKQKAIIVARNAKQELIAVQQSVRSSKTLVEKRKLDLSLAKLEGDAKKIATAQTALQKAEEAKYLALKKKKAATDALSIARTNAETKAKVLNAAQTKIQSASDLAAASSKKILNRASLTLGKGLKSLRAAFAANPIGLIATGLTMLIPLIIEFTNETSEAERAQQRMNDLNAAAKKSVAEQTSTLKRLLSIAKDETKSKEERQKAIKELNKISPEFLGNLTLETINTKEAEEATKKYTAALLQNAKVQAAKEKLVELEKEMIDVRTKGTDAELSAWQKFKSGVANAANPKEYLKSNFDYEVQNRFEKLKELKKEEKRLLEIANQETVKGAKIEQSNTPIPATKKQKAYKDDLAELKEELEKSYLEMANAITQAEIDGMQEGLDKTLAQNSLNHKIKLEQLEEQKAEHIKKLNEIQKAEFLKSGGKEKDFKAKTELSGEDKEYFDKMALAAKQAFNKGIDKALSDDDKRLKAEKEKLEKLAQEFESFQQKRLRVSKEYDTKIKELESKNTKGQFDENIAEAQKLKEEALLAIDTEIANQEIRFLAWSNKLVNMSLVQLQSALETAKAALEGASGNQSEQEKTILRAKIGKLQGQIKQKMIEGESLKPDKDAPKDWKEIHEVMTDITGSVNDMVDGFDNMDEATKTALKTASNIATSAIAMISGIQALAVATGESIKAVERASIILTIISSAVAIISTISNLFNQSQQAESEHRKRLIEIKEAQKQQQLEYNALLREQNALMEESTTIFGEKEIAKAAAQIDNYRDALQDYYAVLKGEAPTQQSGIFAKLYEEEYEKQLAAYEKGVGALSQAKVVTGSKTVSSGFLGLGKSQKDVYSSMLEVYPDLIDNENRLNIARAEAIISTDKMSDADKKLLENLIELEEEMQEAEKALESYLESTFGSLGDDLMTSIVNAIQSGSDAWEEFGDSGKKVLENLGKQLAYSLYFSKMFEDLENELKDVYSSTASEEEMANQAATAIEDFYNGVGGQMESAQGFLEQWNEKIESFDLFSDKERQASQKGFASMSQDSADELNGRFTALQGLTSEINQGVKILSANSNRILEHLAGIESNTEYCKRLEGIESDMHSVKMGIDTINTKGITLK